MCSPYATYDEMKSLYENAKSEFIAQEDEEIRIQREKEDNLLEARRKRAEDSKPHVRGINIL